MTMTKLGRDLNKYAETKKFDNVKMRVKKVDGKACNCWFGVRSVVVE